MNTTKPLISWITSYYDNWTRLQKTVSLWATYPKEFLDQMEYIIVDDGSTKHPLHREPQTSWLKAHCSFPMRVYRIKRDTGFNNHAARNIGAFVAYGSVLVMTDMTLFMTAEQLEAGFREMTTIKQSTVLYLKRPTVPRPNPNNFVIHKTSFWTMGAYNEDLNDIYGTDFEFRGRVKKFLKRVEAKEACVLWDGEGHTTGIKGVKKRPRRMPKYSAMPKGHLRLPWTFVWASEGVKSQKMQVSTRIKGHDWFDREEPLFYLAPIVNHRVIFRKHQNEIFPFQKESIVKKKEPKVEPIKVEELEPVKKLNLLTPSALTKKTDKKLSAPSSIQKDNAVIKILNEHGVKNKTNQRKLLKTLIRMLKK